MEADLEELRITQTQLEKLTGLDVGAVFVGGTLRPSALRSSRRLLSLLATELSAIAVSFIICLGIGLIIIRSWTGFSHFTALFMAIVGITIATAIAWHFYRWRRYQFLKSLVHLLDEVDRHNDIVQAIRVVDELEAVQSTGFKLPNRVEVMTALTATRESLISALMTERILRRHQHLIQRRQELFSSIETNLATLKTLTVNNQATEYQQFLQEALEIGLAVQQEMKAATPSKSEIAP